LVLAKDYAFQNDADCTRFEREVAKRSKMNADNVCKIISVISKNLMLNPKEESKGNLCSNFYKLTVIYEFFEKNLDQIYRHRSSLGSVKFEFINALGIRRRGYLGHNY